MKEIIEVKRPYGSPSRVIIGDVLKDLAEYIPAKRVIIITDSNVHRRYMDLIDGYEHIIIGMGETNKTLVTMEKIYRELLELSVDRECFILGFGGGIVTDITGFAASTYMRGLSFGFVASTLLAQVDASVGGKNGVNLDGYKNMVGTFNQPDFVLCDTGLLATLPEREFKAGLAEIIKSGLIANRSLFDLFASHTLEEFRTEQSLLTEAITGAVKVKADIVAKDEREAGERKKLNLGHTFAHAIEKSSSNFLHGEAVAIGLEMVYALAEKMGSVTADEHKKVVEVLVSMGLPVDSGIDIKKLLKALRQDKKKERDSISLIIPESLGSCTIRKMTFEELEAYYN